MSTTDQAIDQFCSYFEREIGEISRLVLTNSDGSLEHSAASGLLYRKVLYVTMLDTLAGVRFNKKSYPDLSKQNRNRFSHFVVEHCSWSESEFVSLPLLFEKLKQESMVSRPLGQFVSDKLSCFSHEDGGSVKASTMDERESELLQHAATDKETKAISKCKHVTLLYGYRNYLVHESREPGYAMEAFARDEAPYYHGYLGNTEWHLGYPLAMFGLLVRNGLVGFSSYLKENAINPYSALDDVQRW